MQYISKAAWPLLERLYLSTSFMTVDNNKVGRKDWGCIEKANWTQLLCFIICKQYETKMEMNVARKTRHGGWQRWTGQE